MVIQEYERMPLQDIITTEFVGPEVRQDGSKRLILSWIHTCAGQHSDGQGQSNFMTREIAKNFKTQENCEEHVFKSN